MKKMIRLASALLMTVVLFSTTSCDKEDDIKQEPLAVQLLTAKAWQIEEVVSVEGDNTPHVTYKRGATDNEDDFSLVRQNFKKDGSITYIDQEGDSGSNGRYQLMANNMMRLSVDGLSTIVENVIIRENSFSYRLVHGEGYTQFTFSPVQ
ncbi:MAG TPA: hypothetical protein VD794_08580 [Flavisolibacter sp.]|nr:hypothetical protein [Flavisolibacter sp.]